MVADYVPANFIVEAHVRELFEDIAVDWPIEEPGKADVAAVAQSSEATVLSAQPTRDTILVDSKEHPKTVLVDSEEQQRDDSETDDKYFFRLVNFIFFSHFFN